MTFRDVSSFIEWGIMPVGIDSRENTMLDTILNVAQIVPVTEAEGPGLRFALWFQGCPLRCPGCCNPEMLPFSGGTPTTVREVLARLDEAREQGVEGITLLGGEPLAHASGGSILAREARARGLSVMVFSGHTLDEARANASLRVSADSVRASLDHWSTVYGVDPRLARATAWMESGFQTEIVSTAGARGVLQTLPSTRESAMGFTVMGASNAPAGICTTLPSCS